MNAENPEKQTDDSLGAFLTQNKTSVSSRIQLSKERRRRKRAIFFKWLAVIFAAGVGAGLGGFVYAVSSGEARADALNRLLYALAAAPAAAIALGAFPMLLEWKFVKSEEHARMWGTHREKKPHGKDLNPAVVARVFGYIGAPVGASFAASINNLWIGFASAIGAACVVMAITWFMFRIPSDSRDDEIAESE